MIIIVLGAGIDEKGRLSKETVKRLKEASRIHKETNTPLLVSGKYSFSYNEKNIPSITEAEVMHDYLVKLGVDSKKITVDKESEDTIFAAYHAKTKYFDLEKDTKAIIVTSDIHLERVEYIFHKVFGTKYNLHFVGLPSGLPCQTKGMVLAKQAAITQKAKELLDDIEEGDHEAVKEKASRFDYRKENPDWSKINYKKTC